MHLVAEIIFIFLIVYLTGSSSNCQRPAFSNSFIFIRCSDLVDLLLFISPDFLPHTICRKIRHSSLNFQSHTFPLQAAYKLNGFLRYSK